MWPDRESNRGPLTYESGALPTALRGPATCIVILMETVYMADISFSEFSLSL